MVKLEKLSSEEHVAISKKMFYGGFAFLPFLWLVNFMYFYKTSRQPNAPHALKRCNYTKLNCIMSILTWTQQIFISPFLVVSFGLLY